MRLGGVNRDLLRVEDIQGLREHQLPIDCHQRPKDGAHVKGNGKRQRGKHIVLDTTNCRKAFLRQHFVRSKEVVQKGDRVVDDLQNLWRRTRSKFDYSMNIVSWLRTDRIDCGKVLQMKEQGQFCRRIGKTRQEVGVCKNIDKYAR